MSRVHIERVGDRIHLRSRYSPEMPQRCKNVAGARWAKSLKVWTYPLNMTTCRDLRGEFGDALDIGPELLEWAREQRELEQQTAALLEVSHEAFTSTELDHLPRIAPTLYQAMTQRPWQLAATRYMGLLPAAINGDQPRMGKTLDTIGAALESFPDGGVHLVLAPKTSARVVWEREIARWCADVEGGFAVIRASGLPRTQREERLAEAEALRNAPDRPSHIFVVGNIEMARTRAFVECSCGEVNCSFTPDEDADPDDDAEHKAVARWLEHEFPQLFSAEWSSVTVDESHKALITFTTKIWSQKMSQQRRGMAMLKSAKRWADTGTPFKGKTKNLWGTLNWLRPDLYPSFWTWAASFLHIEDNGYGKEIGELRKSREAEFYRSLDAVMIRRTKAELRAINPAWAPPPKLYDIVYCEMEPKQRKQYEAMRASGAAAVEGGEVSANNVLAEMTRLRQFAHSCGSMVPGRDGPEFRPAMPSGKFNQIVASLAEYGISGDKDESGGSDTKVVIGSQFTRILNMYSAELRKLGIAHHLLTGETPDPKRDAMVQEFQSPGGPRVFMINTTAGGVSITLDAAEELWVLDETWVPDDQEQLEERVSPTTDMERPTTIRYFITLDTMEEEIAKINATSDATQKRHLDGRRGVEFGRQYLRKG